MSRFPALFGCAILLFFTGCLPGGSNLDEEKDPHYQRGRSLASSQDFKGAIVEFEKALETNPRSSAAHFELGWLFDDKIKDYAAAIYHYERHLLLRPDTDRADRVKERIKLCKQELAKSEFSLPNTQNLQREVDRLAAENLALKQQLENLQAQLRGHPAPFPIQPEPPRSRTQPEMPRPRGPSLPPTPLAQPEPKPLADAPAPTRSYTIKSGDTIDSIARRYGVKSSAVLAANPKVDPQRLRPGQNLYLPTP